MTHLPKWRFRQVTLSAKRYILPSDTFSIWCIWARDAFLTTFIFEFKYKVEKIIKKERDRHFLIKENLSFVHLRLPFSFVLKICICILKNSDFGFFEATLISIGPKSGAYYGILSRTLFHFYEFWNHKFTVS